MTDAERYAITVRKVVVDDQELWRATVRELPDLAEFGETREEAIELALDAIENLKRAAQEEGRPFPQPLEDEEEYSGRVTLRMSKSLHRAAALRAQTEDVSLNSYIVECVAVRLEGGVTIQARGSGQTVTAVVFGHGGYVPYHVARTPLDYSKFSTFSDVMLQSVMGGATTSVGAQITIGTGTLSWDDVPPNVEPLLEHRRRA